MFEKPVIDSQLDIWGIESPMSSWRSPSKQIMSFPWVDNLHSTAFTPRDFQVELLAAAEEQNIIICLGHNSSKEFIALKLILEKSHQLRRRGAEKKITLYITSETTCGDSTYNLIFHLTDLKVINLNAVERNGINWDNCFTEYQVVILNIDICLDALLCSYLELSMINLIVIEECHKNYASTEIAKLFQYVTQCRTSKPKILGLAGPLHSAGCNPGQLGFHLNYLERSLQCKAETASDIVTVLRSVAWVTSEREITRRFHSFQVLFKAHRNHLAMCCTGWNRTVTAPSRSRHDKVDVFE